MKPFSSPKYWLFLIFSISLFLRFLGLNQIDNAVFDEIFYPQYGLMYLQGEEFFYAHPPLANYLYSFAIGVYSLLPWTNIESIQTIEFSALNPISYRWLNALLGSLLPLIIYRISFLISKNMLFSLLCGFLIAIEGSLIVDSRIALANIFLLTFGFTALYFLLRFYLIEKRTSSLIIASVFMGMAISVKWSGLGFLLVAFFLMGFIELKQERRLDIKHFIYLLFFSVLTYTLLFVPDLYLNENYGFLDKHRQILGYHQIMVTENEHPYCSKWFTWPFMLRPVGYYFDSNLVNQSGILVNYFTTVHLLPNPFIYWLSTLSIIIMILDLATKFVFKKTINDNTQRLMAFVCFGYLANLLPWAFVERCLFLYHYQAASVFSFLALAWYLSQFLVSNKPINRIMSICLMIVITLSFLYWLPIHMGLSIPEYEFSRRMWFQGWI